jgi:hypothetical protein
MSKKFFVEINLGNDAMLDTCDISEALIQVCEKIMHIRSNIDDISGKIRDVNGNIVGSYGVKDD